MSGAYVIFYLLALVLPLAALVSRRTPGRTVLKLTLAWVAISVIGFLIISSFT